ncbi:RICIN domain-containing protein [Streptomyces niveiscabiei]|uniref:RICIN domain-containing protein n=1 Tax=Streptomyces niveiscabiei TaxID=164115 RepID=UPI0029C9FCED|nr:RICIN domain-containing protein [Streptomyces niveiscabiei]
MGSSVAMVDTASAQTADTNTWYTLVNRNTGKALDDYGSATNDGAPVVQWSRTGAANQQWKFLDSGDGYYRLLNRASGKVLDDSGWSKTEGSELVQWSDGNSANQQWRMADSPDGYVRLVNRFSGMAAEVPLNAKADGGHIAQAHDWNGANQQWQLAPAGSASAKSFMGGGTVLVGAQMDDPTAAAAPFDMRYACIHSQPAPSSDYYTAARCKDEWKSWWGCWGGSSTAPGNQVTWAGLRGGPGDVQGQSTSAEDALELVLPAGPRGRGGRG